MDERDAMRWMAGVGVWLLVGCSGGDGAGTGAGTGGSDASVTTGDASLSDSGSSDAATDATGTTRGDAAASVDASRTDVACPAGEVECNGACLTLAQPSAAGCKLVGLNFEFFGAMAATRDELFYSTFDTVERFDISLGTTTRALDAVSVDDELYASGDDAYAVAMGSPSAATNRDVFRMRPDGSSERLVQDIRSVSHLSVRADTLFFKSEDGVYAVPVMANGAQPQLLYPTGSQFFYDYAADASTLYVWDSQRITAFSPWDAPTGTPVADYTAAEEVYESGDLLVWREFNASGSTVWTVPKTGGTPSALVSGVELGATFALQDGFLYGVADGVVRRLALSDGTITQVARLSGDTRALVLAVGSPFAIYAALRDADVDGALLEISL